MGYPRVSRDSRIIYIEPNDVFDKDVSNDVRSTPLTPKYEDMCISFKLIIETYRRVKSSVTARPQEENKSDKRKHTYEIEWGLTQEDLLKQRTSILQGDRGEPNLIDASGNPVYVDDRRNFLTTYFTDIDFASYKKKTQIEGLGVENVQISYESYYTPTVTIKFVDVRGSALWGREEAIHIDEQLVAENVFGAFFTMPYPLFRLQVKGFFGKPVTYQLTCSNFKGEFNSQTGNFEATATFIGYSWSLLTDIPFAYLVSAPYATYIGNAYWQQHKNSEAWQLWDIDGSKGVEPPRLFDLFKNIRNAMSRDVSELFAEQEESARQIGPERAALIQVRNAYYDFMNNINGEQGMGTSYIDSISEDGHQQLLFFSNTQINVVPQALQDSYRALYNAISAYSNGNFQNPPVVTIDDLPNKFGEQMPNTLSYYDAFNVQYDTSGFITAIGVNFNQTQDGFAGSASIIDATSFQNLKLNETSDSKLTYESTQELRDVVAQRSTEIIKKYCYLFDLYNLGSKIKDRLEILTDEQNRVIQDINNGTKITIEELLEDPNTRIGGFKPYIRNVFKIIFCHVETFCHIMFESASDIYKEVADGRRTMSALGIPTSGSDIFPSTDILPTAGKNILPWPAIFDKQHQGKEAGYNGDIPNVYGWVGDIARNKFIEQKVVYGFQEGIQQIIESRSADQEPETKFSFFPSCPIDFIHNKNPFLTTVSESIVDVAANAALRIAIIAGIMGAGSPDGISNKVMGIIGRMDAFNLYKQKRTVGAFQGILKTNPQTADNLEDDLADALTKIITRDKGQVSDFYEGYLVKKNSETVGHLNSEIAWPIVVSENVEPNTTNCFFNKIENGYVYSYVPTEDSKEMLVPSFISSYGSAFKPQLNVIEMKDAETDTLVGYTFNLKSGAPWLHTNKSQVIQNNYVDGGDENSINTNMFSVVYDEVNVKKIKSYKQQISNSSETKLGEYTPSTENGDDFSQLFSDENGIILAGEGDEQIKKFATWDGKYDRYTWARKMSRITQPNDDPVSRSPQQNNNLLSSILGAVGFHLPTQSQNVTETRENGDIINTRQSNVSFCCKVYNDNDSNFWWQEPLSPGNIDALDPQNSVIQDFKVFCKNDNRQMDGDVYVSLFGSRGYYKANDPYERACYFLHSLRYNYDTSTAPHFLQINNSKTYNGCVQEVTKGYLLFLGCLCYMKDKGETYTYLYDGKNDPSASVKDIRFMFKSDKTKNIKIDYFIKNIDKNKHKQLKQLFEQFVTTNFNKIQEIYEIKQPNGETSQLNAYDTMDAKITHFVKDYQPTLLRYQERGEVEVITTKVANEASTLKQEVLQFFDFTKAYDCLSINQSEFPKENNNRHRGVHLLMKEESEPYGQQYFKELYYSGSYIVADSGGYFKDSDNSSHTTISEGEFNSYITGFSKACHDLIRANTINPMGDDEDNAVSPETLRNRDLSVAIYYYLKNLWDKWLITAPSNAFDVSTFFDNNFVFTDSFYNNVSNHLAINCGKLLDAWDQLADNGSLFSFISRIVTDHGCIFLPVPDYIGFNGQSKEHDIAMMEDLFRPLPYNAMDAPSNNNKFIVMFTHSPSKTKDESNAYPTDSYDIWSYSDNNFSKTASTLFKTSTSFGFDPNLVGVTAEGYNVPSFGVSFGRQNNHIFKNLRVTMENPVMTEQAIKAQWNIALKGSSEAHSVSFVGQDTFNVFTNYSYSVDVEMMGNAQICPLMYFQLLNIPMWRGTYMIYKVVHNMTPGNMTTTVTAMKMSKFAQPFNTTFFQANRVPKEVNCEDDKEKDGTNTAGDLVILNPRTIEIEDNNHYNLVLWRHKADAYESGNGTYKGTSCDGNPVEGVIYEYDTNKVICWTLENHNHIVSNHLNEEKRYTIVWHHGDWENGTSAYRVGCVSYVKSVAEANGVQKGNGYDGKNMAAYGENPNCLFHPGKNLVKWTTGCTLCGSRPKDGNRNDVWDEPQYYKDNIATTQNIDVAYWRNFYDHVVPQLGAGKKVSLYVRNTYSINGRIPTNGEQPKLMGQFTAGGSGGSSSALPQSGNLVSLRESLGASNDSLKYEIIPMYATGYNFYVCSTVGDETNATHVPGYAAGQTDLYVHKSMISGLKTAIKNCNNNNWTLCFMDAFRPQKAVTAFSKVGAKSNSFNGLIAKNRSQHNRGAAVDVTVKDASGNFVKMSNGNYGCFPSQGNGCIVKENKYVTQTGGVDVFSNAKYYDSNEKQKKLRDCMTTETGLKGISSEWWHFELTNSSSCPYDSTTTYDGSSPSGQNTDGGTNTQSVHPDVIYDPISVSLKNAPNREIKYLAIHYTAGDDSNRGAARAVKDTFEYRATTSRPGSADFAVDDVEMVQFNPDIENKYCIAVGSNNCNHICNKNTISIEICSSHINGTSYEPNHEGWYYTEAALNTAVRLAKILMQKYNIDKNHVVRHFDAGSGENKKECPGIIGWNTAYMRDKISGQKTDIRNNEDKWLAFKRRL